MGKAGFQQDNECLELSVKCLLRLAAASQLDDRPGPGRHQDCANSRNATAVASHGGAISPPGARLRRRGRVVEPEHKLIASSEDGRRPRSMRSGELRCTPQHTIGQGLDIAESDQ
jgi:hypothetical protein